MDEIDVSQLEQKLRAEVERIQLFSCRKIILTDFNEFRKLGNFSDGEIDQLKSLAAKAIIPVGFKTANETKIVYKKKWRNIRLDCKKIDSLLGGGIPTRGITELSGESGAGKTQFCLQASITVQYPEDHGGLGCGAVYICTEDRFPAKRLNQMTSHFPRDEALKDVQFNFSDHILVDHIPDVAALKECIFKRLPLVLKTSTIGLVIIDSIAAVFRGDYTPDQYMVRAKDMRSIGIHLHNLAREYNVAIVCVNQMADSIENEETIPALGLVWANLVTTKLQVAKSPFEGKKLFKVLSAPHLPPAHCAYQITAQGIESS